MSKAKENPWWLEEGSEVCPTCHQTYVLETEYRCVDCDGPMCAHCVVRTVALEIVCLPCNPAPKARS